MALGGAQARVQYRRNTGIRVQYTERRYKLTHASSRRQWPTIPAHTFKSSNVCRSILALMLTPAQSSSTINGVDREQHAPIHSFIHPFGTNTHTPDAMDRASRLGGAKPVTPMVRQLRRP